MYVILGHFKNGAAFVLSLEKNKANAEIALAYHRRDQTVYERVTASELRATGL